jgi:hypothetical protein
VLAWDGIEDALAPTNPAIAIGHLRLVLDNTRPGEGIETGIISRGVEPTAGWPPPPTFPARRVSDLLRVGTNAGGYDLGTSEALLEVAFEGHDPATEAVRLFRLMLDDVEDVSEDTVTLNCSGVELAYEDWDTLLRITTDRFPDAAPEAVGQVVPLLCGDLHRAKVHFVQAGVIDRLRVEVPETQAVPFWLQLSEPERVRRLPVPGQLQIEGEVLTYDQTRPYGTATEIATVHITERGARETTPAAHRAGAEVLALSSSGQTPEYVGIIGQNRAGLGTQSWTQVYSDGMAKDAAASPAHTVELANTTLWPGQSLAVVRFASTGVGGPPPLVAVDWGFATHLMGAPPPTLWETQKFHNWSHPMIPHVAVILTGHTWPVGYPDATGNITTHYAMVRFSLTAGPVPPPLVYLEWWTQAEYPWIPNGNIILDELDWTAALSLEAVTAPIRHSYGIVMRTPLAGFRGDEPVYPGDVRYQWGIAPSLEAAQAEGRTMLTFRWRPELDPIEHFPGAGNWGLHVSDPWAP